MDIRTIKARLAIGTIALAMIGVPLAASADTVQTDGRLNVLTSYRTLDALSWDVQTWPWKANHDHLGVESLLKGDLSYGPRDKNEFTFHYPDHIPDFAVTGSLAESWEVSPEKITFHLRDGVTWMEVPGVMEARPLVASDVVNHFEVMWDNPRAVPGYWDFIDRWEAVDDHTVVAHLNEFHANWDYRIGWGFWDGILPPEWHALDTRERADWKNAPGTGPYRVSEVRRGREQSYDANPDYWGTTEIDGQEYQLPLNAGVTYHVIRDESAAIAAFTAGQVDVMEVVRWQFIDQVKRAAPEVQVAERLQSSGDYIALRNDRPPFDDVRVRRAMNLAIDQRQILDSLLDGKGELLNFPFGPGFGEYHDPVDELPEAARELFEYNPERAKELLAEAGYPNGFEFEVMHTASNPYHLDLIAILQAYYAQIGVTLKARPLDYPVFVSQMRADSMSEGYLMLNSSGNPISVMRKTFQSDQTWNASMHSDPEFDRRMAEAKREHDSEKRLEMLRELNHYILTERVPHVWLPSGVNYIAWWPWVKNFAGETRVGAMKPNDPYAHIWIDEELKREIRGN